MNMRFMIIRKADAATEAGVPPDDALVSAMLEYQQELIQAGVMRAGEGLQPSASGVRIRFSQGIPSVTDGPFAGTGELVAGFSMYEAPSLTEAIDWIKRWPTIDGAGELEIEIRETGCPGGLAGVPPSAEASAEPGASRLKRFMVMLKANSDAEAGVIPDAAHLAKMARHNADNVKAGVILAADGLQPSARGARVKFSGGKPQVIDGPFSEAKELIAGYWLIQAPSRDAAIAWALHYPYPFGAEAAVEIRQVIEAEDFGPAFTAEFQKQEARLRLQAQHAAS